MDDTLRPLCRRAIGDQMEMDIRENGTLVFDGIAIGRLVKDEQRLVLNLGWMKAADLKITVEGDPSQDRKRVVLARPQDHVRLNDGDQLKLGEEPEATTEK